MMVFLTLILNYINQVQRALLLLGEDFERVEDAAGSLQKDILRSLLLVGELFKKVTTAAPFAIHSSLRDFSSWSFIDHKASRLEP